MKTKAFIIQKSLDTAFLWPIRFRQKVLMVFFELRWNYSPLKEKAVLLPDGLFICFCRDVLQNLSLRSTPLQWRPRASRPEYVGKFVASLQSLQLPITILFALYRRSRTLNKLL